MGGSSGGHGEAVMLTGGGNDVTHKSLLQQGLVPKPGAGTTFTFSPLLDSGPSMSALRCTGGAV